LKFRRKEFGINYVNIYAIIMISMKFRFLTLLLAFVLPTVLFSQPGKDGPRTADWGAGSNPIILNTYTFLTANAASGNQALTVSNNAMTGGHFGATALGTGDLILIIQMQGATINTSNTASYGTITNYNNCGLYEYCCVAGVSGTNTINLTVPLTNNYTASGNVQIIRVPRLTNLRVRADRSIVAQAWNGQTGGVIALEVRDEFRMDNATTAIIDANNSGFRGGALDNTSSSSGSGIFTMFRSTAIAEGARKGEGIAGNETNYDTMGGRYGRGAPANGGGGGNSHNGGGGGGANAGAIGSYTGLGNPSTATAAWANAWNLESAGFATSTSSGGGRGGYTYSANNEDALVTGTSNAAWGGNSRHNTGGRGGRPLDYSTGRIFMGGGGGAGCSNNDAGSAGARGAGIVFVLHYGTFHGNPGLIRANGTNAANTVSGHNDAPGGGGGGGAIIFNTTSAVPNNYTLRASGGNGGSQLITNNEAEGPGGGGSGGFIAISAGTPTRITAGGANGTTTSASMTEFVPNGATVGGVGINNASISATANYTPIAKPNAGSDLAFCNTTFLQADPVGAFLIGEWSYISGPAGTFTINNVNDPNSDFTSTETIATYSLLWTATNNLCQQLTDTIELTIDCILLPISMKSFYGKPYSSYVELFWSTTAEINNDFFTIERSADRENWEFVGQVSGAGNSNSISEYTLIDFNKVSSVVFYRLSQTNFDGVQKEVKVIKVSSENANSIVVYPNPARDKLTVTGDFTFGTSYTIFNTKGQMVASGNGNGVLGFEVSIKDFTNGTYFIQIFNNSIPKERVVFIKQD